jgi:hypothetical protein
MTGDEWARCADPVRMVESLEGRGRLTDRKTRLLACALLRRFEDRLADEALGAIGLAERYADSQATADELAAAAAEVWTRVHEHHERDEYDDDNNPFGPATRVLHRTVDLASVFDYAQEVSDREATGGIHPWEYRWAAGDWDQQHGELVRRVLVAREREGLFQAALVRELFGDPSRPSRIRPGAACLWTDTVRQLARVIDERQDFTLMPILADALEDAGCDDRDLLDHCRHGTTHARGCWALDLVLGRK